MLILIFTLFTWNAHAGKVPTDNCKDPRAESYDVLKENHQIGNIRYRKIWGFSTEACNLEITFEDPTSANERKWVISDNGQLLISDFNMSKNTEHNQVFAFGAGDEPEIIAWKNEDGTISQNGFTVKLPNGEKVQVDANKGRFLWQESYNAKTTSIQAEELLIGESLSTKEGTPILKIIRSDKNTIVAYGARRRGQVQMTPWHPIQIIHPMPDGRMKVCNLTGSYLFSDGEIVTDKKTKKIKFDYKDVKHGGKTWFQDYSVARLEKLEKNFCNEKNTEYWSSGAKAQVTKKLKAK